MSQELHIDERGTGQRLDNFLIRTLKGVPKSLLYRLIRQGHVRLNGRRAKKAETRLAEGDTLMLPELQQTTPQAPKTLSSGGKQTLEKAILFEDEHLLVLNKPAGWAVHGGSGVQNGLVESLRLLKPGYQRLELAHRLDRGTSGCLLLAKKASVLKEIHALLREHRCVKRYRAVLDGVLDEDDFWIRAPLFLQKDGQGKKRMKVDARGKSAETHVIVEKRTEKKTWARIFLKTGRMHQIRAHMAHVGVPVLGDSQYGSFRARGPLCLHADKLSFTLPSSGHHYVFQAPLPAYFELD